MGIKYINANWQFDQARWSAALSRAVDNHGLSDMAEMLELSESTVYNWSRGHFHKDAPYPNMTNYLTVCNLLDLHPAIFFWVGEGKNG